LPDVLHFILTVETSYDLPLSLKIISHSPSYVLEDLSKMGVYRRTLTCGGETAVVVVRQPVTETGRSGAHKSTLEVELQFPESPPGIARNDSLLSSREKSGREKIFLDKIRRIFSLDVPGAGFKKLLGADPVLKQKMFSFLNARPIGFGSFFEALVWAILEQQLSAASARSLKLRFLQGFGKRFPVDGADVSREGEGGLWRFPEPQDLGAAREHEFRSIGLSRQKSSYILGILEAILSGKLDVSSWEGISCDVPAELLQDRLTSLRGFGRWSAEYVLMRGLLRPDLLCASDLALRTILAGHYGGVSPLSVSEVRRLALKWEGFEGWICHFWWYVGKGIP
jgi:DNA-3-methyladenine glycosylase II